MKTTKNGKKIFFHSYEIKLLLHEYKLTYDKNHLITYTYRYKVELYKLNLKFMKFGIYEVLNSPIKKIELSSSKFKLTVNKDYWDKSLGSF